MSDLLTFQNSESRSNITQTHHVYHQYKNITPFVCYDQLPNRMNEIGTCLEDQHDLNQCKHSHSSDRNSKLEDKLEKLTGAVVL